MQRDNDHSETKTAIFFSASFVELPLLVVIVNRSSCHIVLFIYFFYSLFSLFFSASRSLSVFGSTTTNGGASTIVEAIPLFYYSFISLIIIIISIIIPLIELI